MNGVSTAPNNRASSRPPSPVRALLTRAQSGVVKGGPVVLATSTPPSPGVVVKDAPLSVHSRDEKGQPQLPKVSLSSVPAGSDKNVGRSISSSCDFGQSDKRVESKSGSQKYGSVDVKTLKTMTSLLGMSLPVNPSGWNLYRKVFRFASNDPQAPVYAPWGKYPTYMGMTFVPMGLRDKQGRCVGWLPTGNAAADGPVYVSRNTAIDLTCIPHLNPASSTGQICRTGPAIFIHRVWGHWYVQRMQASDNDQQIGGSIPTHLPQEEPFRLHYLQRMPIAVSQEVSPVTLNAQLGTQFAVGYGAYPIANDASAGSGYQAQDCDFYQFSSAIVPPAYPTTSNEQAWDTTEAAKFAYQNDVVTELHRNTAAVTEVFDVKMGHVPFSGKDGQSARWGTTVNLGTDGNVQLAMSTMNMPNQIQKCKVEHEFKEPLKVLYADQETTASYSLVTVNQLRAIFWQDRTGVLLTDASATTTTACHSAHYQELIGFEFFVEFSDCPTQL